MSPPRGGKGQNSKGNTQSSTPAEPKNSSTSSTPSPQTPTKTPVFQSPAPSGSRASVLEKIKENAKNVDQGIVMPEYENMESLLPDPLNPLTAENLAAQIINVVPDATTKGKDKEGSNENNLTMEKLEPLIISGAAAVGVIVEETYLEDLISIANIKGSLSDWDVWMYFRGVARHGQASQLETVCKLVDQMENSLKKCSETIIANAESNKMMITKQNSLSNKIDGVVTSLSNTLTSRTDMILASINNIRVSTAQIPTPLGVAAHPGGVVSQVGTAAGVRIPQAAPGLAELEKLCESAKLVKTKAKEIHEKYPGKITWDEYNAIVSGSWNKEQISKMLLSLKNRV